MNRHISDRTTRLFFAGAMAGAVLAASATPALSWKAYELESGLYAIRCADNTLHSYSGSASGLSTVGPALCEGHGGIAGPGGGSGPVDVKPAEAHKIQAPASPRAKELDKATPMLAK
jgi:hypothetical protein